MRIAFGYKMGCGKDTAVDYLISRYGGTKLKFADPIYNMMEYCQKVCEFPSEKDRKFLQFIGTEWAREKDPDIWINKVLSRSKDDGNYFLSDLRFLNEFNALRRNGWILIKLRRNQGSDREGSGSINHISENELDSTLDEYWDYVIDNNGEIEDLYRDIEHFIKLKNK
jgi:dephospho-CoA kinase